MIPFTVWIVVLIYSILNTGAAYILNTCILVAGARSLRTGQKLNPPDLIQLVIGVVNIVFQCLLVLQGVLTIFFPHLLFVRKFFVPAIMSTLTLTYFTYWLTAWLCIYYCVTISNYNHPFFVWSKKNISRYLPHLLLLSAVGCFFISFPTNWTISVNVTLQSAVNSTLDPIFISGTFSFQTSHIQTASFMGCCVPFLCISVSMMVTVSSLLRHLQNMRQKGSGLSQTKDQAHINAIRTMCLFLTIAIIYYINAFFFYSKNPNPHEPGIIASWLIFISFPTVESLIIIFANPKMRKLFMVKFWCVKRKI